MFCPTGYYPCYPKEVGSVTVKVELESISMDLQKVVELSHVRITQCFCVMSCISVASNTKGLQVLRFLSSQPLSSQTQPYNGCQDPTVSQSWEPEMAEDCLDVVYCCICLFYLVVY